MNIVEAMTDDNLFGGTFGGPSWAAWRALLAGFYGLTLAPEELATWQELTGREAPAEPSNELWVAAGRRGGKSHVATMVAVYHAVFLDHRPKLARGEWATVLLIAADRAQARTLLRYVRGAFEHPMLKKLVKRETAEGVELVNRCIIEVGTASFRSVRGYTLAAAILDEVAFWHSDGANPDVEVVAAVKPALATLGGPLIAISSPYARRGVLWDQYRRHYGQEGRVVVAQAPSRMLNPSLSERVVEDALRDDAARASAEYLAQFLSDIEQFMTIELIAEATRPEPLEAPRRKGTKYVAFVDPAGGGADEFTIAIGHEEKQTVVVDLVRGRRGNPAAITAAFAELCKDFKIRRVYGDRYSGEWARTEFRRHGLAYLDAPGTRSELYLSLLPAMSAGRVELPPCPTLERQLVGLERRTTRAGRDIIDHAPGGNDDRANAVAGLVALLATEKAREPAPPRTSHVRGLI